MSSKEEFHISYGDYVRFRDLVLKRSGLYFPEKKRVDLETGLLRALSESACCANLDEYYELLRDEKAGQAELEALIVQLTIGETHFFRNKWQFDALRNKILPKLIAERRGTTRQLRIWSAGCATGEEPYSIAILLRELIPDIADWHILILATDINKESLRRAKEGLYTNWAFRETGTAAIRERYFTSKGKKHALSSVIKEMVTFDYLNLVDDNYPSLLSNTVAMDIILCRNVTIYFTEEVTRKVVAKLYEALVDRGWLVVGHAEPSSLIYNRFAVHNFPNTILYRKEAKLAPPEMTALQKETTEPAFIPPSSIKPRKVLPKLKRALPILPFKPLEPVTKPAPPPPPKPEEAEPETDWYETAQELLEQGHMNKAMEKIQARLKIEPGSARAHYLLGRIHANMARWDEARTWCEKAIEEDKLLAPAYYILALVYQQQDQEDEAIQALKKMIYLDRNSVLAHFEIAGLYRRNGKYQLARKSLENVIKLLQGRDSEEFIPYSDGMTVGRLLDAALWQLQSLA